MRGRQIATCGGGTRIRSVWGFRRWSERPPDFSPSPRRDRGHLRVRTAPNVKKTLPPSRDIGVPTPSAKDACMSEPSWNNTSREGEISPTYVGYPKKRPALKVRGGPIIAEIRNSELAGNGKGTSPPHFTFLPPGVHACLLAQGVAYAKNTPLPHVNVDNETAS
ncbi:hypothetical protein FZEAL_3305 [Fusarium zealandicum]|uniref:Uncharacterized protein n=1 Tax=Fusarium zealandicum TaxID=1053134 RepID=A0A8H4UPY7_9HYPO|nr:hypothetical protein FZEAL_3305 [Fusarium zealandicum]